MAGDPSAEAGRAAAAAVDIGAVVTGLLASPEWQTQERSSRSLLHLPSVRVVVTALHRGASLHNDHPDESLTVQGVRGEALVSIEGDGTILDEGSILGIPAGATWRLVATTDAVVLLSVAGPD